MKHATQKGHSLYRFNRSTYDIHYLYQRLSPIVGRTDTRIESGNEVYAFDDRL
jgi:hypothetical protein